MAEQAWGEIYKGGERKSLPTEKGGTTYTVKVVGVRPFESKMLFIDLEAQTGPEQGNVGQVNLFVPNPGDKGSFYFQKKVSGMTPNAPEGFVSAIEAGDKELALGLLADAIDGRIFLATLTTREDGDYAGQNELEETKPVDGAPAPPAAASTAAPAEAAAPAPAASPAGDVASTDEVAALKAQLAALEAAKTAPEPAPAAAAADEDAPF